MNPLEWVGEIVSSSLSGCVERELEALERGGFVSGFVASAARFALARPFAERYGPRLDVGWLVEAALSVTCARPRDVMKGAQIARFLRSRRRA